jgi:hypothetical protein
MNATITQNNQLNQSIGNFATALAKMGPSLSSAAS